jgi:outer membrane receptor protein involved in Fe transport
LQSTYGNFLQQDAFTFGPSAPVENLYGRNVVQAPRNTGNLAAQYDWPVAIPAISAVSLRGEVSYTSSYSLRRFDEPFDIQDGYALGNMYLVVTPVDTRFKLRLFVRNVADKFYKVGEVDNVNIGSTQGSYGPPRTYGFEISGRM